MVLLKALGESIAIMALIVCLSGLLAGVLHAASRNPSIANEVEVQFEYGGTDPEYIHGEHCMDSRVF